MVGDVHNYALSSHDLLHLTNALEEEERLTSLFWMGALECIHPQLQSFFTYQAEANDRRMEELTELMERHAGNVR